MTLEPATDGIRILDRALLPLRPYHGRGRRSGPPPAWTGMPPSSAFSAGWSLASRPEPSSSRSAVEGTPGRSRGCSSGWDTHMSSATRTASRLSQSDRSRSVARRLGIPWLFVKYDRAKWARWYATSEGITYQRFADGFSSVAHMQDWPAVWELQRRGEIPDDAVFVPGHALDFLGGSHIPAHLTRPSPGRGRSRTRSGTPTTSCGAATRRSASMRAADWPRRWRICRPRPSRMSWPPSRPGTGRSARRSSSPTLCASTSSGVRLAASYWDASVSTSG